MMASHSCNYEPIELRRLKAKLAAITCECYSCDRTNCLVPPDVQNDQQVQVGEPLRSSISFDRFTQAAAGSITRDHAQLISNLTKDVLCPSCFLTMNLLRGGALKILKDQESETNHDVFTCDKCIGKTVKVVDCTTSNTAPKWGISPNYVSYGENFSPSDATLSDSSICQPDRPQRSQVKFADVKSTETASCKNMSTRTCVCIDDYMESIRPPIRAPLICPRKRR